MKASLCSSVSFGAMAQRRMDGSFALPLMDFRAEQQKADDFNDKLRDEAFEALTSGNKR